MMKVRRNLTLITLSVILLAMSSVGCGQGRSGAEPKPNAGNVTTRDRTTKMKMKIKIGTKVFYATLFDNPTADAFKAMLPLTVEMREFNGNEKDHTFSKSFPTDESNPKTINTGDLMIWGNNTLVLFYKSFPTSYSYTKLGKIDDPSGLEAAVGKGDVTVTFELDGSPKE
jgi:hypothetical protein